MTESTVFDRLAADYDTAFSKRLPAVWLRQQVRERIKPHLPQRAHVLDVGCGTGDDAAWLAGEGYTVVASDVSGDMLAQARLRMRSLPAATRERIAITRCDATGAELPDGPFDAVWSNFGALNCVAELGPFLDAAAARLRPNGVVALVVMGRFCLWETLGFALRGELRRAGRRWSGHATFAVDGIEQDVWYHAPSGIRRSASQLEVVHLAGIGVFVPSTEFFAVCEQRPKLLQRLGALDERLAGRWPFNRLGDHFLIVLQKTT